MPLINNEPFKRQSVDEPCHPRTKVFVNKMTGECFTSYEEYFDRTMMLSCTNWTCAVSGKSELTFEEAVNSENETLAYLDNISIPLQRSMLYMTTLIPSTHFNDIVFFVWTYCQNRFFLGESVEVVIDGARTSGKIIHISFPNKKEEANGDIKAFGLDPSLFAYTFEEDNMKEVHQVKPHQIHRIGCPKLTKSVVKSFLRINTTTEKRLTVTNLKPSSIDNFGLDVLSWDDIFAGPVPEMDPNDITLPTQTHRRYSKVSNGDASQKRPAPAAASQGQKKKKEKLEPPPPKAPVLSPEEKKRIEDEKKRIRMEERKEKLEKQREEKRLLDEQIALWKVKRDDLECDDLKPLPERVPIDLVPNDIFGQTVMILEFFNSFDAFFDLKDIYPKGFGFLNVIRMLNAGGSGRDSQKFGDLVRILIATMVRLDAIDKDKNQKDDPYDSEATEDEETNEPEQDSRRLDDEKARDSYHKLNELLRKHDLNTRPPIRIQTEILKFHIQSSARSRVRSRFRGWFAAGEDAGLSILREHPDIVETLDGGIITELTPKQKTIILETLIHQVICYAEFRSILEEEHEKFREDRMKVRTLQAEFSKWDRENVLKKPKREEDPDGNSSMSRLEEKAFRVQMSLFEKFISTREKKFEALKEQVAALKAQMKMTCGSYHLKPLGQDRAFRQYWNFNFIPGLFVEEPGQPTGRCNTQSTQQCVDKYAHLFKDRTISKSLNNKENEFAISSQISSNKSKEVDDPTIIHSNNSPESTSNSPSSLPSLGPYDECTSNLDTCFVHGSQETTSWFFFPNPEDLDILLKSLNPRGFRESALKEEIEKEYDVIKESMAECEFSLLNSSYGT